MLANHAVKIFTTSSLSLFLEFSELFLFWFVLFWEPDKRLSPHLWKNRRHHATMLPLRHWELFSAQSPIASSLANVWKGRAAVRSRQRFDSSRTVCFRHRREVPDSLQWTFTAQRDGVDTITMGGLLWCSAVGCVLKGPGKDYSDISKVCYPRCKKTTDNFT